MVTKFQPRELGEEDLDPKKERFRRLAAQRTNAVLDKLRVLGNCANPYQYSYSEDEISNMFAAIEGELKRVRALFIAQKRQKFTF